MIPLSPPHSVLAGQILRFGTVGSIGFLIDSAVLYAALWLGAGPYVGRVASYVVAATANWLLNRLWTFRGAGRQRPVRQWLLFLLVNLIGFAVNYGTYAVLFNQSSLVSTHPVLGVAAGSIAGMTGNFILNRWLVFGTSQQNRALEGQSTSSLHTRPQKNKI
ncbi:GtrA family protein [Teichococcus globiformis]